MKHIKLAFEFIVLNLGMDLLYLFDDQLSNFC